jgi:hypothetical protein
MNPSIVDAWNLWMWKLISQWPLSVDVFEIISNSSNLAAKYSILSSEQAVQSEFVILF